MERAMESMEGWRTTVPLPGRTSNRFLATSERTASRTTVRLTPNSVARSRSEGRRSPGCRRRSTIMASN